MPVMKAAKAKSKKSPPWIKNPNVKVADKSANQEELNESNANNPKAPASVKPASNLHKSNAPETVKANLSKKKKSLPSKLASKAARAVATAKTALSNA